MAVKFGPQILQSFVPLTRHSKLFIKIYMPRNYIFKYCKYILWVHAKASNLATIGELGRFPLYNDICENILKYYSRLLQMNSDTLLGQTLQTSIELHNEGFKTWYSGVKLILSEVNLEDYNLDQVKKKYEE